MISIEEARRFMVDCFVKSHTSQENAQAMADLLVEADYRGHYSHGMNRLEMYINDLHKNSTDGKIKPKILNETPATAWVDGLNGLGAVVGNFCMDLAIEKAKNTGVGVVCAKSNLKAKIVFEIVYTRNYFKDRIITELPVGTPFEPCRKASSDSQLQILRR